MATSTNKLIRTAQKNKYLKELAPLEKVAEQAIEKVSRVVDTATGKLHKRN